MSDSEEVKEEVKQDGLFSVFKKADDFFQNVGEEMKAGLTDMKDKIDQATEIEVKDEKKDNLVGRKVEQVKMYLEALPEASRLPEVKAEPDMKARPECSICGDDFVTIVNPKNWCRMCAAVVCDGCSDYREKLRSPEGELVKKRICAECELKYIKDFRTPRYDGSDDVPPIASVVKYRVWTGIRDWAKRYVVLDVKNKQLTYFKVPSGSDQKVELEWSGGIPIIPGTSVASGGRDIFNLNFPNGYETTFQCSDRTYAKAWRDAIDKFIVDHLAAEEEAEKRRKAKQEAAERASDDALDTAAKDMMTLIMKRVKSDPKLAQEVLKRMAKDERLKPGSRS